MIYPTDDESSTISFTSTGGARPSAACVQSHKGNGQRVSFISVPPRHHENTDSDMSYASSTPSDTESEVESESSVASESNVPVEVKQEAMEASSGDWSSTVRTTAVAPAVSAASEVMAASADSGNDGSPEATTAHEGATMVHWDGDATNVQDGTWIGPAPWGFRTQPTVTSTTVREVDGKPVAIMTLQPGVVPAAVGIYKDGNQYVVCMEMAPENEYYDTTAQGPHPVAVSLWLPVFRQLPEL